MSAPSSSPPSGKLWAILGGRQFFYPSLPSLADDDDDDQKEEKKLLYEGHVVAVAHAVAQHHSMPRSWCDHVRFEEPLVVCTDCSNNM